MFEPKDIKELRLKMMLSQVEFARLLGVCFASVNRYETGKSKPTYKVQRKLKELMDKEEMRME